MRDLHQTMTDRILASVDAAGQWSPPWRGGSSPLPTNAVTGKRYKGVNILSLWVSGYGAQRWASYKQWQEVGAQVKKGERGSPIIFYSVTEEKEGKPSRGFIRSSVVFNVAQVEGAPAVPQPVINLTPEQRLAALDAWLDARTHEIKLVSCEDDYAAYYRPASDTVHMPPFECFNTPEHYYSVLFHEATHWTGAKHRLDRLGNYQGEGRAKEELVAELGASFLAAAFGIENVTRDDHVNYIAAWLKHLKGDKRFIIEAASQASKAVDFLEAIQPAEQKLAA